MSTGGANVPALSFVHRTSIFRTLCGVATLLYALYFVHLGADFPHHSGWQDWSKFTDEGWYGSAALHSALSVRWVTPGRWITPGGFNAAVALPVWPLLLRGWFALTGVGMVSARVLALLVFGVSLGLLFLLLRLAAGRIAAVLAVLLVLVNPYVFCLHRLALLEPLVILLFLLALWLTLNAPWHDRILLRALTIGVALGTMVLVKTTAAVLIPAVLLALWQSQRRQKSTVPAPKQWPTVTAPALALSTTAALPGMYVLLVYHAHLLPDLLHFFQINHSSVTLRVVPQVLADGLGYTLWISYVLVPMAALCLLLSLGRLRPLWRQPLFSASAVALAGVIGGIGLHGWFAPRYYLVCVPPLVIVLTLGLQQLRRVGQKDRRWQVPFLATAVAVALASVFMAVRTARFLVHPDFGFQQTANSIAAHMRADRSANPVLLSDSADDIALFTGIRSVNPHWPKDGLAALLQAEQPGWYAVSEPLDADQEAAMRQLRSLQPVARYHVFDDPRHTALVLYRIGDPHPQPPAGVHP